MNSCAKCGGTKTPYWKHVTDTILYCHKCAMKYIYNSKRKDRRFSFKGVTSTAKEIVRKGKCSWCNSVIDGKNVRRTSLHHIKYHDEDPLKDTVEICNKCHSKLKKAHPEIERVCFDCGSKTTIIEKTPSGGLSEHWYFVGSDRTKFLCNKCYCIRKRKNSVNNGCSVLERLPA